MSLSNTFETDVLEWLFTNTSVTRPTAWYVGLFTTDPTDAGTGTEVSGGSLFVRPRRSALLATLPPRLLRLSGRLRLLIGVP